MKKILSVLAIMLAVVMQASAQTIDNIHVGTGFIITLDEVVPVKGKPAKQMYDNAILWVNNTFKSPKTVIQSREDNLHVFTLNFNVGNEDAWIEVTMQVQFKDGRYKYTISNMWMRFCSRFKELGAKDEPYGDWVIHMSDKAKATWKQDLLKELSPYITSMKNEIISTNNDW